MIGAKKGTKQPSTLDLSSQISRDKAVTALKKVYDLLVQQYSKQDILSALEPSEIVIPASIFTDKLSCFEAIVTYLVEEQQLSKKKIALLVKRSQQTIWNTYDRAKKKFPKQLLIEDSELIPVSILADHTFTVFEAIVVYLKEQRGMRYNKIADLLWRDERTIWTTYQRAKKKRGN